MKKIVLAAMLASGLMAAESELVKDTPKASAVATKSNSGFYIGVDAGNTKFKGTVSGNSKVPSYPQLNTSISDQEIEDDGGSQTFKIGYYLNPNNRVAAFYHNINVESGSGNMYGIGYDYLIGDNAFKPFIGVLAGQMKIEAENSIKVINNSWKPSISGLAIGAQIGLNYSIANNFSIEAGYRYIKSTAEDTFSDSGTVSRIYMTGDLTVKVETVTNWFIGANYKF